MLVQELDDKPRVDQCAHDLPKPVVPLVARGVAQPRIRVGVVRGAVPSGRLGGLEIGAFDHELTVGALVVQRPEDGMVLKDAEGPPRT